MPNFISVLRWCTLRPFQLKGRCRLCQLPHSKDSIEHYACCTTVRELAARRLRLDAHLHVNIHTFTCTNPRLITKELITRAALLIYATYRALNHQRHATAPLEGEDLFQAMCQWVIEGTRGHSASCRVLTSTWTGQSGEPLPPLQSEPAGQYLRRLRCAASGALDECRRRGDLCGRQYTTEESLPLFQQLSRQTCEFNPE